MPSQPTIEHGVTTASIKILTLPRFHSNWKGSQAMRITLARGILQANWSPRNYYQNTKDSFDLTARYRPRMLEFHYTDRTC